MLRQKPVKIAKAAVLAGFVVATVVMSGCKGEVSVTYNGHWEGPVCVYPGDQCEVKAKVEF